VSVCVIHIVTCALQALNASLIRAVYVGSCNICSVRDTRVSVCLISIVTYALICVMHMFDMRCIRRRMRHLRCA